jgi:hypothetical protein
MSGFHDVIRQLDKTGAATPALVIILSSLFFSATAPLSSALEFAADRVTRSDQHMNKTRVFYRDDMWRMEHNTSGPVQVTIVRKDRHVVWYLLPSTRHFKTMAFHSDHALMVRPHLEGELSREVVGTQIMDGHPTTLYEVKVQKPGAGMETYYQWLASDINFPLRLTKKDGDWTVEYRHVRIGRTSDSLFQLPRGYEPIDSR